MMRFFKRQPKVDFYSPPQFNNYNVVKDKYLKHAHLIKQYQQQLEIYALAQTMNEIIRSNVSKSTSIAYINEFFSYAQASYDFLNKRENHIFKETLRQVVFKYQKKVNNYNKIYAIYFEQDKYNYKDCKNTYNNFKTIMVKEPHNYFDHLFSLCQFFLKNKEFLRVNRKIKDEFKEIMYINKPGIRSLEKIYLYLFIEDYIRNERLRKKQRGKIQVDKAPTPEEFKENMNHLRLVVNPKSKPKPKAKYDYTYHSKHKRNNKPVDYTYYPKFQKKKVIEKVAQAPKPSAPPAENMYPILPKQFEKEGVPETCM